MANDLPDWITAGASAVSVLASSAASYIAYRVLKIARRIRSTEWAKSQNDAWNLYNQQKFDPHAGPILKKMDRIFEGGTVDWDNLSYEERGAVYQRLNLLEKDIVGIRLKMLNPADGSATIKSFLLAAPHRQRVKEFMLRGGYDIGFIYIADQIMSLGQEHPTLDTRLVPITRIIERFDRHMEATAVARKIRRREIMLDMIAKESDPSLLEAIHRTNR